MQSQTHAQPHKSQTAQKKMHYKLRAKRFLKNVFSHFSEKKTTIERQCPISAAFRVQELCESRGGRPGLPVPNTVSVDVKQHELQLLEGGRICFQRNTGVPHYIYSNNASRLPKEE